MNGDPRDRVDRLRRADPRRTPDEDPEGRIPPGQYLTTKFPVLTHGRTPKVSTDRWQLRVFGAVAEEVTWDWDAFNALPQVEITSDFHCVTRWSQLDNTWTGISISEVVNHIQILADARYVTVHAHGQYTTNLPLADLLDEEVLFAHSWNGKPLTPEHGGPMRLVVPKLYAWKSAKWVEALEFMTHDRRGFWEEAGYHDRGDPWKEQRFN